MKNQYKQESTQQYQGHWLDVQLVPKYLQMQHSQATLQGIKSTYSEHAKLRFTQLHTQANYYQILEKYEEDMKMEAFGVHIRRKYEKQNKYAHTLQVD